jgi:HEAT repeat protein
MQSLKRSADMNGTYQKTVRHPAEAEILKRAVTGDLQSTNQMQVYLRSNPDLCRIMQETLHDLSDMRIWTMVLHIFATGCWQGEIVEIKSADMQALSQSDRSIAEAFVQDDSDEECGLKQSVLKTALSFDDPHLRWGAAFMLGLRGDVQAIPHLAEAISAGSKCWRFRAIKALALLNDELCGPPLVAALAMGNDIIHREANRALLSMGELAKDAWIAALDHPDSHIRWHAARGLGVIGDDRSAATLAEGLFDEDYVVRWATAEALVRLGARAVPAILTVLSHHEINEPFRQAAYHALHGMTSRSIQERLEPLLQALRSYSASMEAPLIAQRLLMRWELVE